MGLIFAGGCMAALGPRKLCCLKGLPVGWAAQGAAAELSEAVNLKSSQKLMGSTRNTSIDANDPSS